MNRVCLIAAAFLIPHPCAGQSVDDSPRLVDVGGQRLEVVQRGQGHPVVVVEAGSGLDWRNWIPIMDSIAHSRRSSAILGRVTEIRPPPRHHARHFRSHQSCTPY